MPGMLGRAIVLELAKNPSKWEKIHSFSRSQSHENCASNIVEHKLDLLGSPQDMAKSLEGVQAEYIFFSAYLAKDSEEEATEVNGTMLENFLTALTLIGVSTHVKRVVLVTGCKQYGVHLGQPKNPMEETDQWLTNPDFPPNFYYRQQEILIKHAKVSNFEWVVTYPNDVVGVAHNNFMNLATAIALYAVVSKELWQGLSFPGNERFYLGFDCMTDSRLHAQFCEWAALEPKAANQAFNVVNGDTVSWQTMWPKLAKRFGVEVFKDQFSRPAPDSLSVPLNEVSPLSAFADEMGLQGRTPRASLESRTDLTKWAARPEVKHAWTTLAIREGLKQDVFDKATWGFLNFILGRTFDLVISMSKARALGWTGYVDTWQSFEECFDELEKEGIIPKK
ncbi:NAD dependent epimerase/dehydratase family protein [Flagelloscypha sp. PMI_526]|nr:NAD dependent epimerase/dehydratase family protein [Flagelloscypha sp. PMI_526]